MMDVLRVPALHCLNFWLHYQPHLQRLLHDARFHYLWSALLLHEARFHILLFLPPLLLGLSYLFDPFLQRSKAVG